MQYCKFFKTFEKCAIISNRMTYSPVPRGVCCGGCKGVQITIQKKPIWQKSRKKRGESHNQENWPKLLKCHLQMGQKWGVLGGSPPHPQFCQSLHLPKINPTYAPVCTISSPRITIIFVTWLLGWKRFILYLGELQFCNYTTFGGVACFIHLVLPIFQ